MGSVFILSKERTLFVVSFIDIFAVSLLIPILSHYLHFKGYSNFMIGVVSAVYSSMQFIFNPIVGHWSDLYGREQILFVSILINGFSYMLLGAYSAFIWVLIIRFITGCTKHTQLLCKTMIEDGSPDCFQSNYGKLNGFISLGFIIGPTIGGYLEGLHNGFLYICLITGVLFFINSSIVYVLLIKGKSIEYKSIKNEGTENIFLSLRNIPWATCWDIFLIRMISTLASSTIISNYNLFIRERYEVSSILVGFTYSFQGIIGAFTGFSLEKISRMFPIDTNKFKKLEIIYSILCVTFLFQYFAPNFYIFVFLLVPFVICCTILRVVSNELLFENSHSENRGLLLGTFNNITSISRLIVPVLTGIMIDLFDDYSIIFLLSLMICLFGLSVIKIRGKSRTHFKDN